jgi:hypothetical protein
MRDDQIGPKFMGSAPGDMARLPHLINTKKFLVVNDLVRQLGRTTPTLNMPCFRYKGTHTFLLRHCPYS